MINRRASGQQGHDGPRCRGLGDGGSRREREGIRGGGEGGDRDRVAGVIVIDAHPAVPGRSRAPDREVADAAARIETAVKSVLAQGLRTADIWSDGTTKVSTREMGDAVVAAITTKTIKS